MQKGSHTSGDISRDIQGTSENGVIFQKCAVVSIHRWFMLKEKVIEFAKNVYQESYVFKELASRMAVYPYLDMGDEVTYRDLIFYMEAPRFFL